MSTEHRKSGILKSSLGTTFATLLSRILGLVRVRLEALVLGGGDLASGWFIAFAIPNLLRRILGEGALGNALMPLVAECDKNEGKAGVRRELGTVFLALGFLLALIVVLVSLLAIVLAKSGQISQIAFFQTERMRLVLELLPLLMPYTFFMCLVGVTGSVLNYCKEFFLPALGALLLNIFLISGLSAAYFMQVHDFRKLTNSLALLVLLSGAVQLVLMLLLLYKNKCFPVFKESFKENIFHNLMLKKLFRIAMPGMIGGAALQVSFLVDRMLAASLGARAVPALTYVDRLIDLPIGLFAISLGTVLMAEMSRSAASGNMALFSGDLQFGMRLVFFFCIPMGTGVVCLFYPLMSALCLGGRYTILDLQAAKSVAFFYGSGIPVFCLLKILGPAFYARKNMLVPLYASLCAIILNIILNIILMRYLQQGGIALATVTSSLIHCGILITVLIREKIFPEIKPVLLTLFRSAAASLLAAWVVNRFYSQSTAVPNSWSDAIVCLLICSLLFAIFYLFSSFVFRAPEMKECLLIFKRKKRI